MESVTSLTKLLHKEGLIHWSNKIGLQGIRLKDYRKKSCKEGTNKHKQIEDYLIRKIEFPESNLLDKALKGFKIIGVEKEIDNGYICGRADLILEKDGKKILVDFKSTDQIYLEQKLQLSAYAEISGCDFVGTINFNDWKLKKISIDIKEYYEVMRSLYILKIQLNKLKEKI